MQQNAIRQMVTSLISFTDQTFFICRNENTKNTDIKRKPIIPSLANTDKKKLCTFPASYAVPRKFESKIVCTVVLHLTKRLSSPILDAASVAVAKFRNTITGFFAYTNHSVKPPIADNNHTLPLVRCLNLLLVAELQRNSQ